MMIKFRRALSGDIGTVGLLNIDLPDKRSFHPPRLCGSNPSRSFQYRARESWSVPRLRQSQQEHS
jgi:hypothetical protein